MSELRFCNLKKKQREDGVEYLVGVMGLIKVVVMPNLNKKTDQESDAHVFFATRFDESGCDDFGITRKKFNKTIRNAKVLGE